MGSRSTMAILMPYVVSILQLCQDLASVSADKDAIKAAALTESSQEQDNLLCNRANDLGIFPGFLLCGSCDRSSEYRLGSLMLHLLVRS